MSRNLSRRGERRRNAWQRRQAKDAYVQAAQRSGWRSRAVFKLQAIDEHEGLFKRGMRVLDLGAAPGSWSQYAASKVGKRGRVVAADLLEMPALPGVHFIRADLSQPETLERLCAAIGSHADLVLSDMAPNISGVSSLDMPRALALAELAAELADATLNPGGRLVVKLFQGVGFAEYRAALTRRYREVSVKKPAASRRESREVYILARR